MFAVLIALFTTALAALVLIAMGRRRRAPRSTPAQPERVMRHPARGVGAALSLLLLSGAGLAVAFTAANAQTVEPHNPWAIEPSAPVWTPPQLETLPIPGG